MAFNTIPSILARLKRLSPHRLPDQVSDNPQWHNLPPEALARIEKRIKRLNREFGRRFRLDGNLTVPVFQRTENGRIITRSAKPPRTVLDPQQLHSACSEGQIDTLMRTLLVQIDQMQAIGFVHGAQDTASLRLNENAACPSVSLTGLHHGRFTDEPVHAENRFFSPYGSPEMLRLLDFPDSAAVPDDDIFSAGCLYRELLTGSLPGPQGLTPAAALCAGIPLADEVPGPRGAWIHRMLSPDPARRPSAADVLAALNAMPDAAPQPEGRALAPRRFIAQRGDRWVFIRTLPQLWSPGPAPAAALLQQQAQFRRRELERLSEISRMSEIWHKKHSAILPAAAEASDSHAQLVAAVPCRFALEAACLHEYEPSTYLRDARFVDMLLSVQTLHASGWLLGAMSAHSFFIDIDSEAGTALLSDLSSALPMDSLPPPEDIRPDEHAVRILSPELAQYIAAPSAVQADSLRGWIGPASDIFSLGMLYHLLLTGCLPEPVNPAHALCMNAVAQEEEVSRAVRLHNSLDEPHRRLIFDMLACDPMQRPARCDEIACRILDFYTA